MAVTVDGRSKTELQISGRKQDGVFKANEPNIYLIHIDVWLIMA